MMMEEAYAFMDLYLKAKVLVLGGGSNYGLSQIFMDSAQIAVSTRPMSADELKRAEGFEVNEFKIAKDGLAIIVNPVNPVEKLTVDQVRKIFAGKIRNWSEVKGPNWPILVHIRDEMSGTNTYFRENYLEGKNYAKNALTFSHTEAMIRSIYKEKGAVAMMSMSRLYSNWSPLIEEMRVKELAIGEGAESEYILPDEYTVHSGDYPFIRYLYLYTAWEPKGLDAGFITYIMSSPGQKIIAGNGFVPITVPVKYQDSL
jgi:phosphate transport system substrate-binding protein